LDRLSRTESLDKSDRRYLSIVLSALESAILSPRLANNSAGTSDARAFVRTLQIGLAKEIGIAETASIRGEEHGSPVSLKLEEAIGKALVAVHANVIVNLKDTGAMSVNPAQADARRLGWMDVMVNKAQEKTAELLIVTGGAALLPWILKINS
jgi:hypothetical protein